MRRYYGLIIMCMLAMTVGCQKSEMNCNYVIKPLLQELKDGPEIVDEGAYAYVFYADTTQWLPTTWINAEQGLLSSRTTAETKSFDMKVELNQDGVLNIASLTQLQVIVIVCDPTAKIFAWRQLELAENLSYMFVKIRFRPLYPSKEYIEARWTMVNELAPEPEPDPDPNPDPDPDPDPSVNP